MSLHVILGCMYSGKCYTRETLILTDQSYKYIRDISMSDKVIGLDGKLKTIKNIQSFISPCYTITYLNSYYTVSDNHLVPVYENGVAKEYPAHELYNIFKSQPKNTLEQTFSVLKSGCLPPFDPYAVGYFLSEQSTPVSKRFLEMKSFPYEQFLKMTRFNRSYFPSDIKTWDLKSRKAVAEGIIDGSSNKMIFSFATEEVALGISWIFWSVGVPNTYNVTKSRYVGIKHYIKLLDEFKTHDDYFSVPITNITEKGSDEVIGLEVEDSYMFLENFAVGHNSSTIIHEVQKYKTIDEQVLCINYEGDIRHKDNVILTHDGDTIPCIKTKRLWDVEIPDDVKIIAIDEGQFFSDLVQFVKTHLKLGRTIIVAGLDGDYKQQKFGNMSDLIPIADTYVKKYALCHYCKDGTPGAFTKRIVDDNNKILIGGMDMYVACCRKCL